MTPRPTISAVIITLNEEANLRALLPRLCWVDEVVVMDSGSRDATVEVARAHGCRVASHDFESFARQRNRALAMARGDWVLSIDADERPTNALVAEILERIGAPSPKAYRVPIRSRIFGQPMRFSGTQDDRPVRLFRRTVARWSGDVHEVLQVASPVTSPVTNSVAGPVTAAVAELRHHLEHHTLSTLTAFLAKMDRYTTLEAQQRVAQQRPPRLRDAWIGAPREVFRRLIWKHGVLDGPRGWAFCFLSGLSQWVLAQKHRRLWERHRRQQPRESVAERIASASRRHHQTLGRQTAPLKSVGSVAQIEEARPA